MSHGGTLKYINTKNKEMSKIASRLNNYSQFNTDSEFSLDNIKSLCSKLNNIQDTTPSIHVAGTNGKGSVSLFIASIIANSGNSVGLSLSPHLSKVNERIIVNGKPITDSRLSNNLDLIENILKENSLSISYFELLLSLAFLSFKNLDYAVYEVGLGGRLDATNILKKPKVSILTSVGLDHQKFLGNSLEEITREKIGIMRHNSIFVTGRINDSCFQITKEKADSLNTKLYSLGRDFEVIKDSDNKYYIEDKGLKIPVNSSLAGSHQIDNAAVATKATRLLGFEISNIKKGLNSAFMPARLEKISLNNRELILDCAHNPKAFEALIHYIKSQHIDNIDIIFGSLATKDWKAMIKSIKSHIVNWYIVSVNSNRAENPENIVNYIRELGEENVNLLSDNFASINELTKNKSNRKILVTGSMYFIGEFRANLKLKEKSYW